MGPLVSDIEFLDFAWQNEALAVAQLLKLKERRAMLEASGRAVTLHELAREEKLVDDSFEERLAAFVAQKAAPPEAAEASPVVAAEPAAAAPAPDAAPAATPDPSPAAAAPAPTPTPSTTTTPAATTTPPGAVPRSSRPQFTIPAPGAPKVAAPPKPVGAGTAAGTGAGTAAAPTPGPMPRPVAPIPPPAPGGVAPVPPPMPGSQAVPAASAAPGGPLLKRDNKRRGAPAGKRREPGAGSPLTIYLGVAAGILAVGVLIVGMLLVNKSSSETEKKPVAVAPPSPPPPPPPTIEEPAKPDPKTPVVDTFSPLAVADRAVAESRSLRAADQLAKARSVLERALSQNAIASHAIACDILKKELALVGKAEAAEARRAAEKADESKPEPADERPDPDLPPRPRRGTPDPTPTPTPGVPVGSPLAALRERAAALDLAGARELLDQLDAATAKAEKDELDARAAYLDVVGAAIAPGTPISVGPALKKQKIARCSSKGIALGDGSAGELAFTKFPRGALVDLVNATEKTGLAGPPLGAALVLYDLGLWSKGDQRVKAWLDADPASKDRAYALVARSRGLTSTPREGWTFRGSEWISRDEEQARAKDSVFVDGQSLGREDARKLIEKQRKNRAPAKKAQELSQKAKAERLWKEMGVTDVRTVVNSGDPAKRCDIVIVSDGFAAEDLPKFDKVATGVANTIRTIEPWKNYSRYVNVHKVTVVEAKSGLGSSRLGSSVKGDTLSGDRAKATPYGALAPDCDLLVVVANVSNVRATARPNMIALDLAPDFSETVLHELGHAFGYLEDEYVDADTAKEHANFGPDEERNFINVTRESNPKRSKWHYWLLPPSTPEGEKVVCVAGVYYRTSYYRPSHKCRMGSTDYPHYCAVCLEQMEKSLYLRLEPIDDALPRSPTVVVWRDDPALKFEVTAIAIESAGEKLGGFSALWWVDGRPASPKNAGIKTALDLSLASLSAGEHQVACRVDLNDVRVRRDDGLLASSRAWRVKVLDAPRPRITAPESVSARHGDFVQFDASLEGGLEGSTLEAKGPAGSHLVVSERSARFVWMPPRDARGAFRVTLSVGEGPARVERAVSIVIQEEERNVGPVVRDPGIVAATRGQPIEIALEAFDPDGDALVWSCKKLPQGAELDPMTGVIKWTPSYTSYDTDVELPIRVSDGKLNDDFGVKVHVENRSIENATGGFELLVATRSREPDVRKSALAALAASDLASDAKLLELSRLLRDFEPDIATLAARTLKEIALEDGTKLLEARRSLLALDLSTKVWQLSDRPEALAVLKELTQRPLEGEAKGVGVKIQKDLVAIEKYNKDRFSK